MLTITNKSLSNIVNVEKGKNTYYLKPKDTIKARNRSEITNLSRIQKDILITGDEESTPEPVKRRRKSSSD